MSGGAAFNLGLFIYFSVHMYVDYKMYSVGHNTLFFGFKTPEEKQLRTAIIRNQELQNERLELENNLMKMKQ